MTKHFYFVRGELVGDSNYGTNTLDWHSYLIDVRFYHWQWWQIVVSYLPLDMFYSGYLQN